MTENRSKTCHVLKDAFNRKAAAHLAIDFQRVYHENCTRAAFIGGKTLSEECRPAVPNIWVAFTYSPRPVGGDALHIVEPEPDEKVFLKKRVSAFSNDTLHPYLQSAGIDTLLVSGVYARCCVLATVGEALEFGYTVAPVIDAIDLEAKEGKRQAVELYGSTVRPVTTGEVRRILRTCGKSL